MTKEECLLRLKECHSGDIQADHSIADDVLCEFLESLGYREIVNEYRDIEKWYA